MKHWFLIFTILIAGFGTASSGFAGDLWEITTNIEGMPEMAGLGGQKNTVCLDSKTGVTERAAPIDEKCTLNEHKVVGSKVIFAATCPDGKVNGDITSTSNSYNGNMNVQSKDGDMKMKFTGKRISTNSCTVPKAPKVTKAPPMPAGAKINCDELADYAMYSDNVSNEVKDKESACPGFKKTFCNRLSNNFGKTVSVTRDKWEPKAKYCGLSPDKVAKDSCDRAATGPTGDFLYDNCKAEFNSQVKANCIGPEYTTKNSRYEKLCSIAASHADFTDSGASASGNGNSSSGSSTSKSSGSSASDAAKQTSDQTVEGVKKGLETLKGLFGK